MKHSYFKFWPHDTDNNNIIRIEDIENPNYGRLTSFEVWANTDSSNLHDMF